MPNNQGANQYMKRWILLILLFAGMALPFTKAQEKEVTLFLPYIPNIQFAPIYVAVENGYFEEEGIQVTLEHSFNEADGVDRIAVDDLQFGIISGEQVIIARGVEKPLVYVYEWYHNFPVGIVAPADSGITEPADLAGKTVGIPGPFGASYMGFRALLAAHDLEESDMQVESIGFTAPESICTEQVDAAVVYVVNEPVTIEAQCFPVNIISISDSATLVSNGLVTNETTLEENPELVAGMVRAINRGIQFTLENPDEAFDISLEVALSDLPEEEYESQRQVLENAMLIWQSDQPGYSDPARWEATQDIMLEIGFLSEPLDDLEASYSNEFVPEGE
jgi:NitT/TauT family transport system substrate-binding protein